MNHAEILKAHRANLAKEDAYPTLLDAIDAHIALAERCATFFKDDHHAYFQDLDALERQAKLLTKDI